jgi:hypothetical protein
MSDINPENWAEFTTQDGPSAGDDEGPKPEDLQPADMVSDPGRQIILAPAVIDR